MDLANQDSLEQYRQRIMERLAEFTVVQYPHADIHNKTVFDRQADRYLVMSEGWERDVRRIHGCLIDIEIINGKIWVQRDGTEYGSWALKTQKLDPILDLPSPNLGFAQSRLTDNSPPAST
jgi:hypothetical protein